MTEVSPLVQTLLFQIRSLNLPKPVLEHRFHETRKWRWDLAWPEFKVAVECEGGVYTQGRHTRGKGFENDCEKASEGAAAGWLLVRATGDQIDQGKAVIWVQRTLEHVGAIGKTLV